MVVAEAEHLPGSDLCSYSGCEFESRAGTALAQARVAHEDLASAADALSQALAAQSSSARTLSRTQDLYDLHSDAWKAIVTVVVIVAAVDHRCGLSREGREGRGHGDRDQDEEGLVPRTDRRDGHQDQPRSTKSTNATPW